MVARVGAFAMVAVAAGLGGGGWYYSDELLPVPTPDKPDFGVEVVATDPAASTVTLAATDGDLAELGTVGLLTEDGLLLLDGPAHRDDATTTRHATLLDGAWPVAGKLAASTVSTYAGDPASALGLPYEEVDVQSELGALPAWSVVPNGADPATWVVIVHSRGAGLDEGNRLLPTLDGLALPSLTVSVRNDQGAPADPDGYGYYGEREWEDVEAAVEHLRRAEDAERILLVGFGHGGSTVLSFLERSAYTELVEAAVLVSPLVSLHETLAWQARESAVPNLLIRPLLTTTRWICSLRAGLDFDAIEHGDHVDELPGDVPLLITHGSEDEVIPVEATRAFAAALGSRAVYQEYDGVGHGREWNADRARFEADLQAFLEDALAPSGS